MDLQATVGRQDGELAAANRLAQVSMTLTTVRMHVCMRMYAYLHARVLARTR